MLALTRQLLLVTLGANCNRYLRGNQLRKLEVLEQQQLQDITWALGEKRA